MEDEAIPSNMQTRSAELPEDFAESNATPKPSARESSSGGEDREAVPPDGRAGEASESKLERCEKAIHDHLRDEIEFSRAACEITENRLFTEKGFESLGEYTKATFGVGQNQFRKYGYHAKVFDIIEENREEIAEHSLTNVRDVPLPRVKAWTRPLHKKANKGFVDQVVETWAAVVRRHGSSITGKRVRRAREEVLGGDNDPEGDSENGDDLEGESSEDAGDADSKDDPSGQGSNSPECETEESSEENSADNNTPSSSSHDDSSSSSEGSGNDDTEGFSIDVPDGAQDRGVSAQPTPAQVEDIAQRAKQKHAELTHSTAEHMVASKVWRVLVPSPTGVGAGLPEENSAEEEPLGAVLKPGRLDQIVNLAPGQEGERVLVCPGVDLFGGVVPNGAIEAILDRCRTTDHNPVVFTRHLGRASNFDLSGLWVGTATGRSSLETAEQRLADAAPDAAVRWLLYDVQKRDRETPPSFSDSTDWIVYEPAGGTGVVLTLSEAEALANAAVEAEAGWAFRDAFKTCGASYPTVSSS